MSEVDPGTFKEVRMPPEDYNAKRIEYRKQAILEEIAEMERENERTAELIRKLKEIVEKGTFAEGGE